MGEIPVNPHERRVHLPEQYSQLKPNRASFGTALSRLGCKHRHRKAAPNNMPTALRAQAAELRSAKANLERSYNQEENIRHNFSVSVRGARARAERRFVNCLIRYRRDANQMTAVEATEMQRNFTRQKMEEVGVDNKSYLMGMYPCELN